MNDNPRPRPRPSPHGTLAEALAEIARTKAAAVEPCPVPAHAGTTSATARAPRRLAIFPKTAGARPCTSFERDKRILKKMEAFSRGEAGVVAVNDAAPSVEDPSSSTPTLRSTSRSAERRRRADENDKRRPPVWTRTTEIIKGRYIFENIATRGAGLAWTLNLGPYVVQAANDSPAGWRAWMHDRLTKAIEKFLEPRDFVWEPEFTPGGRLHIHGAIDAMEDEKALIEAALSHAGGMWGHTHGKEHQALAKVMWGAAGWARYTAKAAAVARRFFGCKSIISATQGVRRRARAAYESDKAAYEARQRSIAVEELQPTPAAAAPASDSQNAPAPDSRLHDDPAAVVRMPLPVPIIVIRVVPVALDAAWTMIIRKTMTRRSAPRSVRPQLGIFAIHLVQIAAIRLPQRFAAARSRGPPCMFVRSRPFEPRLNLIRHSRRPLAAPMGHAEWHSPVHPVCRAFDAGGYRPSSPEWLQQPLA
ncbi:hypothetical protein NS228_12840 [Methylobacterium indicum]|nr:hypothetical protein NS229_16260 [Methylobacterium indicum]KTS40026.1 hypothetical protein NS228_12840 [Methylobacterium indicum]KTS53638.1 hypothetical protein NS230_04990 [Methylobacterium indicum]